MNRVLRWNIIIHLIGALFGVGLTLYAITHQDPTPSLGARVADKIGSPILGAWLSFLTINWIIRLIDARRTERERLCAQLDRAARSSYTAVFSPGTVASIQFCRDLDQLLELLKDMDALSSDARKSALAVHNAGARLGDALLTFGSAREVCSRYARDPSLSASFAPAQPLIVGFWAVCDGHGFNLSELAESAKSALLALPVGAAKTDRQFVEMFKMFITQKLELNEQVKQFLRQLQDAESLVRKRG